MQSDSALIMKSHLLFHCHVKKPKPEDSIAEVQGGQLRHYVIQQPNIIKALLMDINEAIPSSRFETLYNLHCRMVCVFSKTLDACVLSSVDEASVAYLYFPQGVSEAQVCNALAPWGQCNVLTESMLPPWYMTAIKNLAAVVVCMHSIEDLQVQNSQLRDAVSSYQREQAIEQRIGDIIAGKVLFNHYDGQEAEACFAMSNLLDLQSRHVKLLIENFDA